MICPLYKVTALSPFAIKNSSTIQATVRMEAIDNQYSYPAVGATVTEYVPLLEAEC